MIFSYNGVSSNYQVVNMRNEMCVLLIH